MYSVVKKVKSGDSSVDDVFIIRDSEDADGDNECTVREIYDFVVNEHISIKGVEIDEASGYLTITCQPESGTTQSAVQTQPTVYESAVDDEEYDDDEYGDEDDEYGDEDDEYDGEDDDYDDE